MSDERQRQRELDLYRIVDSLPDAAYDDIARLASMLCDAPIALVSLIDRDRQWFKARQGLDTEAMPRDIAFCDHAIRQPDRLMEVRDAAADARFAHNPLVTGDLGIRFYAGMPLVTPGGAAIGAVCVIDHEPRELDAGQRTALESLARLTMNLMEGTRRERQLERAVRLEPAARVAAAAGASDALLRPYSIAIFQLQEHARLAGQQGERVVERTLQEADRVLASVLTPGDSIDRVTGSGEFIALLHGATPEAAIAALRARFDAIERELGTRVLHGVAQAASPSESPEHVYLRADAALGAAKDALRARSA
ncbi:GAF domain-containing protein [Cognatilysobacter segetis]|uniref:GAF domain-containing protein n=1 Tax=Cognatilysobacter segetis TaxID=2492394 RepID=UPI001EE40073|nr:GAF domain-containing protein [Lysobacter segetis]